MKSLAFCHGAECDSLPQLLELLLNKEGSKFFKIKEKLEENHHEILRNFLFSFGQFINQNASQFLPK